MSKLTSAKPIIEIKNLSFSYQHDLTILKNINLVIEQGDFVGIIGPNGGGKSTLIKLMTHILPMQNGEISLFGQPLKKFKDWPRISYISQKATNFDQLFPVTVFEVVSMGRVPRRGLLHSLTEEDEKIIEKVLAEVEMLDEKNTMLYKLSGGQQQRVFIAKALAQNPELLIMDEPTIGVDINTQEKFYKLLRRLRQERKLTIILISHDIDVIANEVNRFACLNQELIYHGTPKGFIKEDYLEKLYGKDLKHILHGH